MSNACNNDFFSLLCHVIWIRATKQRFNLYLSLYMSQIAQGGPARFQEGPTGKNMLRESKGIGGNRNGSGVPQVRGRGGGT